jgi:hypothetical protein
MLLPKRGVLGLASDRLLGCGRDTARTGNGLRDDDLPAKRGLLFFERHVHRPTG